MRRLSILLATIFAVWMPCVALAHAALLSSDPVQGAVLDAAPVALSLTFNEPVTPLVFRWITPDGAVHGLPEAALHSENGVVTVDPPQGLNRGSQVLSWRVASADGHPVGGTLSFAIGAASGEVEIIAGGAAVPATIARWALTVALVLGVGGAVFAAFVANGTTTPGTRSVAIWASMAVVPLALLAAGLQGADILGTGATSLLGVTPWIAVAGTGFAWTAGLAGFAALLALAAVGSLGPALRWLAFTAWGIAALSFIASGHTTTPIKGFSMALHAIALIFWIGALPGLALSVNAGTAAAALLRRFSALAVPMVIVLIGSGIFLTLAEAGTPAAIVQTAWGRLLLVKLGFVAVMLALAVLNRQWLTPALAASGTARPISRSIRAELCLAIVVLALATGFRLSGTPTPPVPPQPGPTIHIHGKKAMADITLASASRGPNRLQIEVANGDFGLLQPREAEASLELKSSGIEKLRLPLHAISPGLWASEPFTLPAPGRWDISLRLLIDDFTSVTLSAQVDIAQ